MQRRRFSIVGMIVLTTAATGLGQVRVLPPSPVGPSSWHAPRGRVIIAVPFGGGHYGAPFASYGRFGFPHGYYDSSVSVHVIVPPRRFTPEVDLSGIDLDAAAPPWAKDVERPKHDVPPAPRPDPDRIVKPEAPKPAPPLPPDPLREPRANPIEEGQRITTLGVLAFRARDYGLAARKFTQAIEIDTAATRAYVYLGQANFALGNYRDAVQMIGVGLGLDPAWPKSAFRPRFDLYSDPADWQRHSQLLEDAHNRQPNNTAFLFLLAHQRWFDDQRDEAVKLFRQVRPHVADPALVDLFLKANAP